MSVTTTIDNTLVSVIVAVYNAEDYLEECLESLIRQTHFNLEILCVDDASTDNSLLILQKYAEKDNRIKILNCKENQGQAFARNIALDKANGDYICMLDSDDWFSTDAIEKALTKASETNADCVLFDLYKVFENRIEHYVMPKFNLLSGSEAFEKSLTWEIHGLYIIKADIHKHYPYDTTTRSYSDDNTTRIHYLKSDKVAFCSGRYYYRQHNASTTHQISRNRFDYLRANESMRKQLLIEGVDKRILSLYERERWLNIIGMYMFYYLHRNELSASDCKYGLQEIQRVWKQIDYHSLPLKLKVKFGYIPFRFSWLLFRLQEETYFTLRKFFRKNKEV